MTPIHKSSTAAAVTRSLARIVAVGLVVLTVALFGATAASAKPPKAGAAPATASGKLTARVGRCDAGLKRNEPSNPYRPDLVRNC